MASDDGSSKEHLIEQISEEPWAYDFFQIVRRLECLCPDQPRIGTTTRPSQESIRFGQHVSMAFAPAALSSVEPATAHRPPKLLVNFTGMLGPNGPLPLHLTQYVVDRIQNHHDRTMASFLDIFNHRIISLLYRSWAVCQPTVNRDRPGDDLHATYLRSLIGVGFDSMQNRDSVPDDAKIYFAGRLGMQTHNAEGLQAILSEFFDVPTELDMFVGQWVDLSPEDRCYLGGPGEEVFDRQEESSAGGQAAAHAAARRHAANGGSSASGSSGSSGGSGASGAASGAGVTGDASTSQPGFSSPGQSAGGAGGGETPVGSGTGGSGSSFGSSDDPFAGSSAFGAPPASTPPAMPTGWRTGSESGGAAAPDRGMGGAPTGEQAAGSAGESGLEGSSGEGGGSDASGRPTDGPPVADWRGGPQNAGAPGATESPGSPPGTSPGEQRRGTPLPGSGKQGGGSPFPGSTGFPGSSGAAKVEYPFGQPAMGQTVLGGSAGPENGASPRNGHKRPHLIGEKPTTGVLGQTTLVGSRFWDVQQKFRVAMGPLSLADYERLLPSGDSYVRLCDWVKNYVGVHLNWELKLILDREEVPRTQLGCYGRLGWTSWLSRGPLEHHADQLLIQISAA